MWGETFSLKKCKFWYFLPCFFSIFIPKFANFYNLPPKKLILTIFSQKRAILKNFHFWNWKIWAKIFLPTGEKNQFLAEYSPMYVLWPFKQLLGQFMHGCTVFPVVKVLKILQTQFLVIFKCQLEALRMVFWKNGRM